ncbi:hypothetical protein ACO1O0_002821 [Amphichorda felina]
MQLRYNVAASLDGYIAPPDESTSWIVDDPTIDFGTLYASFDVFIMGRKTYEIITSDPEANPLKGRSKESVVVVSRTLNPSDHPGVTIMRQGYISHIRELKKRDGQMWVMGGGWLATECLEAGLLDGVDVAMMPVVLGSGFRLIAESGRSVGTVYKLVLRNIEKLDSGILMTEYDVVYDEEQAHAASDDETAK